MTHSLHNTRHTEYSLLHITVTHCVYNRQSVHRAELYTLTTECIPRSLIHLLHNTCLITSDWLLHLSYWLNNTWRTHCITPALFTVDHPSYLLCAGSTKHAVFIVYHNTSSIHNLWIVYCRNSLAQRMTKKYYCYILWHAQYTPHDIATL